MAWLISMTLTNAVLATLLALVAFAASRLVRSPALTHLLWVVVLLKLITPPLVQVPIGWKLEILPEPIVEVAHADPSDDWSMPSSKPSVPITTSGSLLPSTAATSG